MIVAIGFAFLAYSYFMVINATPMRVGGTEVPAHLSTATDPLASWPHARRLLLPQLNTKQKIGGVVAITAFLFFITSGFTILWVAGIASLGTHRTHHTTRHDTTRHAYALLTRALLRWRARSVRSGPVARGPAPAVAGQQGVVLPRPLLARRHRPGPRGALPGRIRSHSGDSNLLLRLLRVRVRVRLCVCDVDRTHFYVHTRTHTTGHAGRR